jgi:hypothetical protein
MSNYDRYASPPGADHAQSGVVVDQGLEPI